MPRHVNPTTPDRTATAPYNFVPLPNQIFTVDEGIPVDGVKIKPWECHDRFVPGTHSGWIECTIELLTPLYVRGAVVQRAGQHGDSRDARLRPDPYCTPDGRPAIPGSSLRGMVRALVEVLAFAKVQPVSPAKPFFRTVTPDRMGEAYTARMRRGQGVQGGFLRRRDDGWAIEPCRVLRVDRDELRGVRVASTANETPPWPPQHSPCWVRVGAGADRVDAIHIQEERPGEDGAWQRGTLVLTGHVRKKRREFVFLDVQDRAQAVHVPQYVWDRFHDEDQITPWQARAFPRDKPEPGCRRADGYLRSGEPVFFVRDDELATADNPNGLVFLGRAGMFRLPYDVGPADLVPSHLANAGLDLAEAMFGRLRDGAAIKGRVFFEDAVAVGGGPDWFEDVIVPRVLSAPKVTTFQHYLTQDGTRGPHDLTTYLRGDHTTIRGHKWYWHRWSDDKGLELVKESPEDHDRLLRDLRGSQPADTQHTIIRPVKGGTRFAGRVRFENLTDIELGALLCALDLPTGCAHKLGMGKPLGLGSVRIEPQLKLVDRAERYRSWRASGATASDGSQFRRAFEEAIVQHARASNEPMLQGRFGLRRIARLDALFFLLEWQNRPASSATASMDLARFRQRPVLPTPHAVAGAPEPPWPCDPPRPAASGRASARRSRGADDRGGHDAMRVRPVEPIPAPALRVGAHVEATLLEEKTRKGGWKARHEPSGLAGPIQNTAHVPAHHKPGDRVVLIVASVGIQGIAFRFPTETGADASRSTSMRKRKADRA